MRPLGEHARFRLASVPKNRQTYRMINFSLSRNVLVRRVLRTGPARGGGFALAWGPLAAAMACNVDDERSVDEAGSRGVTAGHRVAASTRQC